VFNALAQHEAVNLHVIFLSETDSTQRDWRIYKEEIRFSYEVLPAWRRRIGDYNILLNRRLWPALNGAEPAVVICGGYNYLASWQALLWARRKRVPLVLWSESTAQDQRSRYALLKLLKLKFLRACTGFVASGNSARHYLQRLGFSQQRIVVAPDAVDNYFFERASAAARKNEADHRHRLGLPAHFFLFVGRMVYEKGVFDLLQAYARLEPEVRASFGLIFAGTGKAQSALLRQAGRLGCAGEVQCVGFAQREELAAYYALADALILPTHSDPWGLVVNEAMACGLPIVVSEVAGCASDLVQDGWNGCVFRARDVDQLAAAMNLLAQKPELRRSMGHNSRERIRNYSPELCASGLATAAEAFYRGQRV
jgi:1,2-diacylglycerol 3-alpha-glucosyltransferase